MNVRFVVSFAWSILALGFAAGCHGPMVCPGPADMLPVAPPDVPRELDKVTLPDYIIEPPDVLRIDGINLLPKSPYHLNPLDVISVNTMGLPEDLDVTGSFPVQPDGEVQLGFLLGNVKVAGLTVDQVRVALRMKLESLSRDAEVSVKLESIAPVQQILGEHLVAPDGRVSLGTYGRIRVVGMTVEQAARAIEQHLDETLEAPKVSVDVFGYNSKVYYVITQGASLGDRVIILPFKGNETALDAIGQIEGLSPVSSTQMWLARPSYRAETGPQVLPIDWQAITKQADATTNYQVLPGDRVYVAQDHMVNFDNQFAKLVSPIERLMGVTLLSTNTVQRIKFFNQFNSSGGGGFNSGF